MKVKIISASKGTFWYVNQIGSTFTVKISEKHPADYVLDENTLYSTLLILKSDCEVIEESAPQPEPFDLERALKGDGVLINGDLGKYMFTNVHYFDGTKHVFQVSISGSKNQAVVSYNDDKKEWYYGLRSDVMKCEVTMAPKEPEYVEGWVVVTPSGIIGTVFFTLNSAQKSVGDNTWKIEKIRFPKP